MTDENAPQAELEEMGQIPEVPEPELPGGGAPPAMYMAPAAAAPAHKQLYQFLWSGVAILYGCLLPFNTHAAGWSSDAFNPDLIGPIGLMTVGGGITGFAALVFIGAQLYCIKYRKLLIKPLLLSAAIAYWSWSTVIGALKASELFTPDNPGDVSALKAIYTVQVPWFSDFFTHMGVGHLFVLIGSTVPILVFLAAVVGITGKKKNKGAPAADKGSARRGGRKGRR